MHNCVRSKRFTELDQLQVISSKCDVWLLSFTFSFMGLCILNDSWKQRAQHCSGTFARKGLCHWSTFRTMITSNK